MTKAVVIAGRVRDKHPFSVTGADFRISRHLYRNKFFIFGKKKTIRDHNIMQSEILLTRVSWLS